MRRKSIGSIALMAMACAGAVFAGWSGLATAAETPAHAYIGAEKCKMCHNAPAKGAQYTQWTKTPHSQAYARLATEEAKKVGAAKGVADPQNAKECLRCHVTGYGAPAEKLTQKYKKEEGVSCESCHGPGEAYQKMDIMKDQAKSVAAGLIIPNEKTCTGCHNPENPTHKGFDYKTFYAKIAHPNPQAKAAP